MLSLYDNFNVPGISHVKIYRDDENPHKFYMMSERPVIARDDTGDPLFSFLLYARDADRLAPDDLEVQRGYVQLSVQAGVTPEVEQAIRTHLRQRLNGELNRGYRFLGKQIVRVEPELGYPPIFMDDGSVELSALGDTGGGMVLASSGSKQPSLMGANTATFSMLLNQEGSELFRQAVLKNVFPATVFYKLRFAAVIPAIKIHIWGNLDEVYDHVKDLITITETHKKDGKVVYRRTWPEIGSITEFRSRVPSLHIEIDNRDFRDADPSEDATKKLEEMALTILQTNIIPSLFKEPITGVTEEQSKDKWLQHARKEEHTTIDIWMERSDVVNVSVNPNAMLTTMLTAPEIEAHTAYVDLSNPVFQELDVKVHANVNFVEDPVFALKVFMDYDQQDELRNERIKFAKELTFKSGDEVKRFRKVMAKGTDGAVKDEYNFWSQIVYKDTGQTIRIPASGTIKTRERELIISYRRLGFVKVKLLLGAVSDLVKAAHVTMRYPGSTAPTAQQSFELTRDNRTASYFTYTGSSNEPGPYFYKVTYILADGQRMDLPEQQGRGETLDISDPFEKALTTTFLAQADFAVVEKVVVDARYRDATSDFSAEHHAELSSVGASSPWVLQLRNPDQRGFSYDVLIIFKNGAQEKQTDLKRDLGGTIPVGIGATAALDVNVIPSLVDWTKYKLVIASLRYHDDVNNVHAEKSYTFREMDAADQLWRVLLRDPAQRSYEFKLRFFGQNSADNRETDWKPSEDNVLVVE
ncbi:MAG: hypothetical protein WAZ19_16625 [Anaerolineae bacterium]